MGGTKRYMEDLEQLHHCAMTALLAVGAVKECEWHDGEYLAGNEDLDAAYRYANSKVTSGDMSLPDGFSRRQLTDKIKELGESYWQDECGACAKW